MNGCHSMRSGLNEFASLRGDGLTFLAMMELEQHENRRRF
jgi:hypothetical protein